MLMQGVLDADGVLIVQEGLYWEKPKREIETLRMSVVVVTERQKMKDWETAEGCWMES
jgi:hypothetical protein